MKPAMNMPFFIANFPAAYFLQIQNGDTATACLQITDSIILIYHSMPFDQYHEPANELPEEVRTFARMIASLIEEAEAIGWYEQRISVEKDNEAKSIMKKAQEEEFIHFAMDLEFLLRKKDKWQIVMKNILFKKGDITENAEKAEDKIED